MRLERVMALRDAGREVYLLWEQVSVGHGLLGDGQRRMAKRMFKRLNQMIVEAGGVPLSEAEIEEDLSCEN